MKKFVMLCSLLLLFSMSSWAQVTVTIGTGTSTDRYPLNDYFVYSQSQCLYLASEIGLTGTITKLRWYRDDTGADPNAIGTTEIWLMETTNTTLTGTTWEGPGTLVATISNMDLGSGDGWYEVDITDFAYSGTQNLLVSVYTQNAPYTSPHSYWRYTTATDMARNGCSDTQNPPTLYLSSSRPNIQFDIIPTTPYFTLAPSSLTFGYVPFLGSSAEQSYTISGDNLTAGPVVVTAPAGFGVSLTSGGPYTSTVNVSYTPPTLATTTIFSNFTPLAANTSYNSNITNIGGGATGNLAVTGTSAVIYCTPTYASNGTADFITQVTLNTLSQATASNVSPYYIDYTSTQNAIPDLYAGVPANLSLTFGSDGNQFNGVWIDFDQNGVFDATEFFTSNSNAGANGTVTVAITVPVSATLGQTRMRIRGGEDSQLTSAQACGASSSGYGQAQDYFVNIIAPPACLPPSALTATNITTSSAAFGWTENGTATSWNIELGQPGFTPGTGTSLTGITGTTDNPWTASGGTGNTTYEFYVQADCGGSSSTWAGPFSFTTLCDAISTFPYTEDFNGVTTPALPVCYSAKDANSDGDYWKTFPTYGVAGTTCAGMYTDYNGGDNDDYLILPQFTLNGNQRLKFSVSARSTFEPNDYKVVISTTDNNPASFTTELMPLTTVSSTTMTEIAPINLSAYTGNVWIAIYVPSGGLDGYYLYVDNIVMEDIPACEAPSNLTATNITANSADLGWTEIGSATLWNVELGLPGFTPGTGTSLTGVTGTTSNPWPATGGSSNTTYEFYVQSDCGGSLSAWSGPFSFTTLCDNVTTYPWTENFDAMSEIGTSIIPSCWTIESESGTPWTTLDAASSSYNDPFSAPNYLGCYYSPGTTNKYVITPAFYFEAGNSYEFSFKYAGDGYSGWTLDARYNTSPTGTGSTIMGTAYLNGETSSTTYNTASNIFYPTVSGTYYFIVHVYSTYAPYGYLGLDDFMVTETTVPVPVISNLENTTGCVGSTLVIDGTDLSAATNVTIGGTVAEIIGNTGTTVTVTVGTGTTGTVEITTPGGTATSTQTFTVNQLPSVFTVSGGGTYCAGGTGVTITLDGSVSGVNYDLSTTPVTTLAGTGSALSYGPSPFPTGVYTITATDPITSCSINMSGSVTVTTNPIPANLTANASLTQICNGASIDLTASHDAGTATILAENFNAPVNNWTTINNSTGGTPEAAAWTLQPDGFYYNTTFHSNDNSQFYNSNSDAQGSSSTTATILQSPAFNTVGYLAVTLDFYHYYYHYSYGNSIGTVEASTDGLSWTSLQTYTADAGSAASFAQASIALTAPFINQPQVFIRFKFDVEWGYSWSIDNVSINGTLSHTYSWTSNPAGFTSTDQNPLGVIPSDTTTYTVQASNSLGCSASANVTVNVNPIPAAPTVAVVDNCSNSTLTASDYTGTLEWSTTESTSSIIVTTAGTYTVNQTVDGCASSNGSGTAAPLTVPVVNLGTDITLCGDQTTVLDAGNTGASYLWTPGGQITQTITVDSLGLGLGAHTFSVLVTDPNTCSATGSIVVTFDPCTGIESNDGNIMVSVVPNPSNGMFYLNVEGINETVTLNIYTINGKVIYTEQLDNTGLTNKPIDLKSYPKGMYFLRLINNNMTHTEKIIIE